MRVVSERQEHWERVSRAEAVPARRRSRRPVRVALIAVTVVAAIAVAASVLAHTFGLLGAIGGSQAHPGARAAATSSAAPSILPPDAYRHVACQIPPQQPTMMTPAELSDPVQVGVTYNEDGYPRRCTVPGLAVPPAPGGAPDVAGQVILISLSQQWLWAYQDRNLAFANPVTTGKEWLWTPQGTYHIQYKVQDTWFYSPWGPDSPYYYAPEHVNYALYFRDKGYYIHDAPWRHAFGPGTNVPHTSPDGTQEDGSHGCVNVATTAGKWLFDWTQVGATVIIVD